MRIVIDTVIFQLQSRRPLGISRVWRSLIPHLASALPGHSVLLLRRAGFPTGIVDLPEREIPPYILGPNSALDADDSALEAVCRDEGADVFISSYYTRAPGVRNVLMLYDMIPEVMGFDLTQPEWAAKKRAIATADSFITISQSTRDDLIRHYHIPAERIQIAHCGYSADFHPAGRAEIGALAAKGGIQRPYFLLTGNRGLYKGCAPVFRAFASLPHHEQLQLFACGGEQQLLPDEAAAAEGINFSVVPWLHDSELRAAYSGALALVYPSRYEGFGLPVLEAMACGCPVITTRNSSLPEVGGDAVLYVNPDQPQEIAAAMQEVMNPDVRVKLASKGVQRARNFSWDTMARTVAEVLAAGQAIDRAAPQGQGSTDKGTPVSLPVHQITNRQGLSQRGLRIVVSYRGVPNARGAATGAALARAFRRLGHYVYEYGNYYQSHERLTADPLPRVADLLVYCEMNDLDPQYMELATYPARVKAYWDFDVSYHPEATLNFARRMQFDHIFVANPLYEDAFREICPAVHPLPYAYDDARFRLMPDIPRTTDVGLVGNDFPERRVFFNRLRESGVDAKFLQGKFGDDLTRAINSLRIHLNYNVQTGRGLLVGRVWETVGSGVFLLTQRSDFIDRHFDDGKHLALYDSDEECVAKVRRFLAHEGDRQRIAHAGYLHGLLHHTYLARAQEMLGTMKELAPWSAHRGSQEAELYPRRRFVSSPHSLGGSGSASAQALEQSLIADPVNVDALRDYGAVLRREGNLSAALALLDRARFIRPEEPNTKFDLACLYAELGRQSEAQLLLAQLKTEQPQRWTADRGIDEIQDSLSALPEPGSWPPREEPRYLVSAVVSVYRSERFLRGCLEDLEAQTLAHRLEIVVVDTGSPQNERTIVEEFQRRYDNIVYIRTEQREGVYSAWNRGIKAARGRYITNANSDDRHRKDYLERMVELLESRPEIELVYANQYVTEIENENFDAHVPRVVYRWIDFDPLQLIYGCFIGPQPMWRKSIHERYGYFDENFESAGDWEFWLRIAETESFFHLDEYLGLYLKSPTSAEHRNPGLSAREARRVHERYLSRASRLKREHRDERAAVQGRVTGRDTTQISEPLTAILLPGVRNAVFWNSLTGSTGRPLKILLPTEGHAPGDALSEESSGLPPGWSLTTCDLPLARLINRELQKTDNGPLLLLSGDLVLTSGWMDRMLTAFESDPGIALVGPVSNRAPEPQRVKAPYKGVGKELRRFAERRGRSHRGIVREAPYLGGFCLAFRRRPDREVGFLDEKLEFPLALWAHCARLKDSQLKLAVVQDAFVHHEKLTAEEGAQFDSLQLSRKTVERALEEGQLALERGDLQEAVLRFTHVTEQFPQLAAGHAALGGTLLAQGRVEESLHPLTQAAELAPGSADLHNQIGVALYQLNDQRGAEEAFRKALEAQPRDVQALLNLTELYRGAGRFDDASRAIKDALVLQPDSADVLLAFAEFCLELGDGEGVQIATQRLSSLHPEHPAVGQMSST